MKHNEIPNEHQPAEIRTAEYGKSIELDCKTDLEPPVTSSWMKQDGSLPKDSYIKEVTRPRCPDRVFSGF